MHISITMNHEKQNIVKFLGADVQPGRFRTSRWVINVKKLQIQLLVLISLSPLYSDVLLRRVFGGFAVTPAHLFLVVISVLLSLRLKRFVGKFTILVCGMILVEVAHALLFGFVTDTEWITSFAQFFVYTSCFVLITTLKVNRDELKAIAPWLLKLGIFFGGIGIVQFLLMNIAGVPAYLPAAWRVRGLNPFDELRAGGFFPAIGLAMEQSYYAMGLVTLLAYIFFLDNNGFIQNRALWRSATLFVLGGVIVSFSLAGIVSAMALLAVKFLSLRTILKKPGNIMLIVVVVLIAAISGVAGPIQHRLQRAVRGADNSAMVRVVAAIRLLFALPDDIEIFLLGTGLGMQTRNVAQYTSIYSKVSLRDRAYDDVKIHNILTTSKFYQGWIGLSLYGLLLWNILCPLAGKRKPYRILVIFLALYHFAWGLYLHPGTWGTLGLLAVLRRSQFLGVDDKQFVVHPADKQEVS